MKPILYRTIILSVVLIITFKCIYAQAPTIIYGQEIVTHEYNGSKELISRTSYDGLGRVIKHGAMAASPTGQDLVSFTIYDCMGHADSISYLPYSGSYGASDHITAQTVFYQSVLLSKEQNDSKYAYGMKKYEQIPQDVVTSISRPGEFHNANSPNGHPVRQNILLNEDSDSIKQYIIKNDSLLRFDAWYKSDQLTIEEQLIDQTPDVTLQYRTYKNSRGQIVAKTVKAPGETCRATYYVYDEYYDDRLRCVISPIVNQQFAMPQSEYVWHKFQNQLRFLEYDERGDMIREFYPGREPIFYIHDELHRVILTQDGNHRLTNHWIYTRYDDLGRIFQTKRVTTSQTEAILRRAFKKVAANSVNSYLDWYFYAPILLTEHRYGGYNEYTHGYDGLIATKIYTPFTIPEYLSARSVDNLFYQASDNTNLKIYEKIAILPQVFSDTTAYVERAFYYDKDGRMAQMVERNAMDGVSCTTNKYDLVGNLLKTHESIHLIGDEADIKVANYTYDDYGRLLTEITQLNDSSETKVEYQYDPLGRCIGTICGDSVLHNSYRYDISNNLTYLDNEVFSMSLYRARTETVLPVPNYAGMISECLTRHKGIEPSQIYRFTYTPYGEFKNVGLQHGPESRTSYQEKNLSYDLNGNILTMQRTGSDGSLIADYTYHYNGNRLDSLTDGNNPARVFLYDSNGNMIFNRKNNWIYEYNPLNLLETIKDTSNHSIVTYQWLADGTKLNAVTAEGNGFSYSGSLVYKQDPSGRHLESTGFSSGRIVRTEIGYDIHYHVRDYLGNVRSVVNGQGKVLECNNYYPFGQRWDQSAYPRIDNRYLFNGKESQEFADLNLLDYGARMYDSDIGRWWVQDPLATKYYPMSAYAYCQNNPINFTDLWGMAPIAENDGDIYGGIMQSVIIWGYEGTRGNSDLMKMMQRLNALSWNNPNRKFREVRAEMESLLGNKSELNWVDEMQKRAAESTQRYKQQQFRQLVMEMSDRDFKHYLTMNDPFVKAVHRGQQAFIGTALDFGGTALSYTGDALTVLGAAVAWSGGGVAIAGFGQGLSKIGNAMSMANTLMNGSSRTIGYNVATSLFSYGIGKLPRIGGLNKVEAATFDALMTPFFATLDYGGNYIK